GALRAATGGAFYGLRDVKPPAISDVAWLAAATACMLVLRSRLTPALALAIELVAQAIATVVLQVLLWRRLPDRPSDAENAHVPGRESLHYAGGAFVMSVLGTAMDNVDKPLVGNAAAAGGYSAVADFHIAGKIVYYGRRLLYIPLSALGPEFTRMWEGGAP